MVLGLDSLALGTVGLEWFQGVRLLKKKNVSKMRYRYPIWILYLNSVATFIYETA